MKQTRPNESLEEALLSKAAMCYSVALALTHDPQEAQDLTQGVLTWAWRSLDMSEGPSQIKTRLLTALRESFVQQRKRPSFFAAEASARTCST